MLQFLRNLFRSPAPATPPEESHAPASATGQPPSDEPNPGAMIQRADDETTRNPVGLDEAIEDLYDEFSRTFCVRCGVTLIDQLRSEGNTTLLNWLHWQTPEPEPKAFIRLALSCTRDGMAVWDRHKLEIYIEGHPEHDGGPSPRSQEGLAHLCKAIGSPIDIFYTSAKTGEIQIITMEPVEE